MAATKNQQDFRNVLDLNGRKIALQLAKLAQEGLERAVGAGIHVRIQLTRVTRVYSSGSTFDDPRCSGDTPLEGVVLECARIVRRSHLT